MTLLDEARCKCSNWTEEMIGWFATGFDMSVHNGVRTISITIQSPWSVSGSRYEVLDFEYDGNIREPKEERWAKIFTLWELCQMMCPDGSILVEDERDE